MNRHNCLNWSERIYPEVYTQQPQKLKFSTAMFGGHISGPFFVGENLKGVIRLVEECCQPRTDRKYENNKKDGGPTHYVLPIRQFLVESW